MLRKGIQTPSDKFKSVSIIKNIICDREAEKLEDEISWSSSEKSRILGTGGKSRQSCFKVDRKRDKHQVMTVEEKVKTWLLTTNVCNAGRKRARKKSTKTNCKTLTLNVPEHGCKIVSGDDADDHSSCPSSPILGGNKAKQNDVTMKRIISQEVHSEKTVPISSFESVRVENITEENNSLRDASDNEQASPVLKTSFKKRKCDFDKNKHIKKKLFDRLHNSDLSQISINFENTPRSDQNENVISETQNQNKSLVIASISDTQQEPSGVLYQISSAISSPAKISPSGAVESAVTFDLTKRLQKPDSPTKKRRKKYPSDSVVSRLQKLIKKQKSFLSVVRHEQYLAANTNFQIPAAKDEALCLKILKIEEEFGKFVLRSVSILNGCEFYTVIVNNYFVKTLTLSLNSAVKVFKPFYMYEVDNKCLGEGKKEYVVINVCRIEMIN